MLNETELEIIIYRWLHRKYSSLFGLLYMCLKSEALYFMDGRFVVIFNTCTVSSFTYFKKRIIKPMDLLYFAVQFYLNLRLATFVSHFFKVNANLVMFTTINIYETILDKYYVHHILKICIYSGMTATTKFVLCQLGST